MKGAGAGSETYAALLEKVADELCGVDKRRWVGDTPPEEPQSAIRLRDALFDDLVELMLRREGVEDPLELIRARTELPGDIVRDWHDDEKFPGVFERYLDKLSDHEPPANYTLPNVDQLRRALLQATIAPWLGGAVHGVAASLDDDDTRGRGLRHQVAHILGRATH